MSNKSESESDTLRDRIAPVLGRIPSGIFVLTAADGEGRETGMLASWVQQASFFPPMISVAINKKRYLNDWLKKSPQLALSLVGQSQSHFLKHFGHGFEIDEPAFDGVQILRGDTGLPVLAEALGYLEGRVTGQIDAGDHIVYLAEVIGAGAGERLAIEKPLVHIRKSGLNY